MHRLKTSFYAKETSKYLVQFLAELDHNAVRQQVDKVAQQFEHRRLKSEPFVQRYALALQFHKLLEYRRVRRKFPKLAKNQEFYQAATFASVAVQILQRLNQRGKNNLRGRIIDELSWGVDNPSLQHEFRVITYFSDKGWEVDFCDLEGDSRFDLAIRKSGFLAEVECKTISMNSGNPVHMQEAMDFLEGIAKRIKWDQPGHALVLEFTMDTRIPSSTSDRDEIFRGAASCIESGLPELTVGQATIRARASRISGYISSRENNHFHAYSIMYGLQEAGGVHCAAVVGARSIFVLAVSSRKASRLINNTYDSIKKGAKQLSGRRPSLIWTHFVGMPDSQLADLIERDNAGQVTFPRAFASRIFRRESRNHVNALAFSADAIASRSSHMLVEEGMMPTWYNQSARFPAPEGVDFP